MQSRTISGTRARDRYRETFGQAHRFGTVKRLFTHTHTHTNKFSTVNIYLQTHTDVPYRKHTHLRATHTRSHGKQYTNIFHTPKHIFMKWATRTQTQTDKHKHKHTPNVCELAITQGDFPKPGHLNSAAVNGKVETVDGNQHRGKDGKTPLLQLRSAWRRNPN
jgi:hypothetical protein